MIDQKREELDPDDTLAHYLTDGRGDTLLVNGEQRHCRGLYEGFPVPARTGAHADPQPLRRRTRSGLMLARILARPANVLILDEPTNDLDIETLDLLQEIVAGFAGSVILVSHDRDFLDRTVTSTIAPANPLSPDGEWLEYAGGYSDMMAQRKGAAAEARAAEKKEKQAAREKAAPEPAKAKGKLSYKQKFALENLPKEMAKIEADIAKLEERMADPQFFARDPDGFLQGRESAGTRARDARRQGRGMAGA